MDNYKNNAEPLFSVIVAAYNSEKWINDCLTSIINQTYKDFELIIVNDGSTDNTLKICHQFQRDDERIKIINKHNEGVVSARNIGIKNAIGTYIVYVDSDDVIDNLYLENLRKVIVNYPNIDMIIFKYKEIFEDYVLVNALHFSYSNRMIAEGYYNKQQLKEYIYPHIFYIGNLVLSNWRSVYKRTLLLKHYCTDTSIKYYEDYCYTYEYIYNCENAYFIDKVLYYYYRRNSNSISLADNYSYDSFWKLFAYITPRLCSESSLLNKFIQISFFERLQIILYRNLNHDKDIIDNLNNRISDYSMYFKFKYCQNFHDLLMLLFIKNNKLFLFVNFEKKLFKNNIQKFFVNRTHAMRRKLFKWN